MTIERVKCGVCGGEVYRSASGILRHTTPASGGTPTGWGSFGYAYKPAEICPGSTRGARP